MIEFVYRKYVVSKVNILFRHGSDHDVRTLCNCYKEKIDRFRTAIYGCNSPSILQFQYRKAQAKTVSHQLDDIHCPS